MATKCISDSKWPHKYINARDILSKLTNQLINQRGAELREKGINYTNPDADDDDKIVIKESDSTLGIKDLEFGFIFRLFIKISSWNEK